MLINLLNGTEIVKIQSAAVANWHAGGNVSSKNSFEEIVLQQHRHNYDLWHEEDEARRTDVGDSVIAKVKRAIDKLNQQRNDCIEKIDDYLVLELEKNGVKYHSSVKRNSETPGSIIDKLSIIALRIFHMNEQIVRKDTEQSHIDKCRSRLQILNEQQFDLAESLTDLWQELCRGEKRLKVYRQFKMYNDASLNPALYSPVRK
jgi:hypothetical protein